MRVVIDTNVYLSYFRFGGLPGRICLYCLEEADVFVSLFIIDEVSRILRDKFSLNDAQLAMVTRTFRDSISLVEPTNPLPTLCRDPDDNHVLQLAEFVGADYLITGDKDLLVLDPFDVCRILSPTVFAEIIGMR